MSARIIDGVAIGKAIRAEVAADVARLKAKGVTPGLAVVLVGENPASKAYVGSKEKACLEAGMHSVKLELPVETSETELLAAIDRLNADPAVHGILVQLPLPKQINSSRVLNRVNPAKDVDGFHPVNVGKLVISDPTALRPCTPWGVIQMLLRSRYRDQGRPCRGAGPFDHRRPPDGEPADSGRARRECDRHHLSLSHAGSASGHSQRRYSDRGDRQSRVCEGRHGASGRRGDRRRASTGWTMPASPAATG